MRSKRIKAVVVVTVLLLLILALGIFWVTYDIPPPDDSDLVTGSRVVVPDGENAFSILRSAFQALSLPADFEDVSDRVGGASTASAWDGTTDLRTRRVARGNRTPRPSQNRT